MSFEPKKKPRDKLAERRAEIIAEYRFYGLDLIRIMGQPISMELALQLGLLVDTSKETAA